MNAAADLLRRGANACLDTLGFMPRALTRRDCEAVLNIENRWKAASFYPKDAEGQPGRSAARLRKSYNRFFKRVSGSK